MKEEYKNKNTAKEDHNKRTSNILGGAILIIIGIILFLNVSGVISFGFWKEFGTFWPLGLILIGIAIIFRMKWFGASLLLLTIILGVGYISSQFDSRMIIESGNYTSKTFDVNSFDSIRLDMPAELYVTQGDEYNVTIEADENFLNAIDVNSENNVLTAKYAKNLLFWNMWEPDNVKIHITSPKLNSIEISGAGVIKGQTPIVSDNLSIVISGTGEIDTELKVQNLNVRIQGFGDAKLNGSAKNSNLFVSGAGDIDAYKLKSEQVKITISGAGDAKVNAEKSLDVTISGAGDVEYTGDPIVTQKISGAGDVKKK